MIIGEGGENEAACDAGRNENIFKLQHNYQTDATQLEDR